MIASWISVVIGAALRFMLQLGIEHKQTGVRRNLGMLSRAKKYGSMVCDQASAAALELGVSEYQFVRRYLERRLHAPLSRRSHFPSGMTRPSSLTVC